MKRAAFALVFFATTLLVFCCRGETASKVFPQTGYGFRLALSGDWDKLPEKTIKGFDDQALKARSDWKRPAIHEGYWMTNAAGFVFPPYVLVRVTEVGAPVGEKTIRDERNEKGLIPPGVELTDPVLDTNLKAYIASGRFNLANGVPAKISSAVIPTRLGEIKFVFVGAQQDLDNHPEIIEQFLKGVQVGEEYQVGWRPSKLGLWLGLASIALIALVLWKAKPSAPQ